SWYAFAHEGALERTTATTAKVFPYVFPFQISYPADFAVHEYPDDNGARTAVFESPEGSQVVQISVHPYAGSATFQLPVCRDRSGEVAQGRRGSRIIDWHRTEPPFLTVQKSGFSAFGTLASFEF